MSYLLHKSILYLSEGVLLNLSMIGTWDVEYVFYDFVDIIILLYYILVYFIKEQQLTEFILLRVKN
jgi:hypothetical protein